MVLDQNFRKKTKTKQNKKNNNNNLKALLQMVKKCAKLSYRTFQK